MERSINVPVTCPKCNKDLVVKVGADDIDPLLLAPNIRGEVRPISIPYEYRITSEDIKRFIIEVTHEYAPNTVLEIFPRYCEKKRRKEGEKHRSYASFNIAFSHHVISNYDPNAYFEKFGESDRVTLIKDIRNNIIDRWCYDPKQINDWMKSYKKLEKLEDGLGMSEQFLNEIREFSRPRSQKVNGSKDSWIFFMASPEKILRDFFTDPNTGKIAGEMKVKDIIQISKDIVEFHITLNPYIKPSVINPHVKQILSGETKI